MKCQLCPITHMTTVLSSVPVNSFVHRLNIPSPVNSPDFGNTGTNRVPVLVPGSVTGSQTTLIDALKNSSPAPPLPNPLRVTQIIRQARNGTCAVYKPRGNKRIAYTPQTGYFGKDRCTYEICDKTEICGSVELFVRVVAAE